MFMQLEEFTTPIEMNMNKKAKMRLNILAPLTLFIPFFFLTCTCAFGDGNQKLKIELILSKNKVNYGYAESIPIQIRVSSSDENIYIDQGFSSQNFFTKIRMIDPAGHLVLPIRTKTIDEYPHALPLPYVLQSGTPVRVAPCEVFKKVDEKDNIEKYFFLKLPGYYTAQVQASATAYKNTCNVDKPFWTGLLKSNTLSFYVAGKVEVMIEPSTWYKSWGKNPTAENVKFFIPYEEGMGKSDYQEARIYLNYKEKLKYDYTQSHIVTSLSGGKCLQTLGYVKVGNKYPVTITGWLKNGRVIGGSGLIIIK